ncbi:ParB/RepB/Spo0J family partition protein [Magnetospirillum fulvum]|uniref:Chromosome partitioning protein n=1 Tax=Magnetospirillum fulvum MGU-K5 TaxID=1316936 RepID=S9SA22_MAGFU|nr:ParB/RepB/Spo0J family partition protein [Magnetospirillum fulvum]EPY00923.1 chromosome partitioning protein [Magnetospirillum fulvum MGU-K5]
MPATPAPLRPIDRVFALAIAQGHTNPEGGVSIRGLARAAGINHSTLINARDGKSGRLSEDTYAALATLLGTTVGALLGEAPPAADPAPAGLALLRLDQIDASPLNPRKTFNATALDELASSIAENGLLQNIVVRTADQGRYRIVAGERRWRALTLLAERGQWDATAPLIPAKVVEADDAEHLALAVLENLQRQDINPMEEAEGFAQLIALDPARYTPRAIADKIGCSARHVQQRLALVERLAPEVQSAVRSGLVKFTQARVLTMASPERQRELVKKIDKFATTDQLKNEITAGMVPATRAIFDLATYTGQIVTNDDTGTRYFADKTEFLAAQRAAAEAIAQSLTDDWAWTDFYPQFSPELRRFEAGTATETRGTPAQIAYAFDEADRHRAGALVHFDPHDGRVTIHTGLLQRRPPDPEAEARQQADMAARAAASAARQQDITIVADQIKAALCADPHGALRLLILWPALNLRVSPTPAFDLNRARGIPKEEINGGEWRFLARFVEPASALGNHVLKEDADIVEVWHAAQKITDAAAARNMGRLVGAALHHRLTGGITPLGLAIAEYYGIDVPDYLHP